jgi:ligand-binding sensor domain-containing protein
MIHYPHDPRNPNSLSDNRVFTILEDSAGILWLGFRGGGLTAFDREKGTFTHYRYDPHVPGSLSHDKVRTIYQDSAGRLWIATMGGGLNRLAATGFSPSGKIKAVCSGWAPLAVG